MTSKTTMRLSDLCDPVTVQVDPRDRPNDVYVGLEHIASGRLTRTGEGRGADVQSPKHAFQPGDILYGKLGPYLDKAVLAEESGLCTTELLVLRPKTDVDPRFLVSVVHAPGFLKHAVAGIKGAAHPRTSWGHIRDFPLPSLSGSEQTRIAELLWRIHQAIDIHEKITDAGMKFKHAAMQALFTRGLRGEALKETEIGPMPESWSISTIANAVKPFRFERSKQIPKSLYSKVGRWPIIDQGQKFIAGRVDDEAKAIRSEEPLIIFGDHTRIFKYVDFEFALGADGTKPLLAKEGFASKYLYHALDNLEVPAHGYSRHYTILKGMRIAKPDLSEQHGIVSILDTIDRKINLHRRKHATLADLFKVLLHKLMTGNVRIDDLDLSAPEATSPQPLAPAPRQHSSL